MASIFLSLFKEKDSLIYTLPLTVICLLIKYISVKNTKTHMFYVLSLVCVIIADVLIFSNFKTNFIYITLLNGLFLLCNLAVLKRYLHEQKIKKILTPSVLISVALVAYVFFYVLRLLIETLPNNQVFFAFCTMSFFAAFFIVIALIYLSQLYQNGLILLIAGISYFFQMFFSLINEFLHYDKIFTTLIVISHIVALFLLTEFISVTKPTDTQISID